MKPQELFQQIDSDKSLTFDKLLGEGLSGIICKGRYNAADVSVKFFGLTRDNEGNIHVNENLIAADIIQQDDPYHEKPYGNMSDFLLENSILEHIKGCTLAPEKRASGIIFVENRMIPYIIYNFIDGISLKQLAADDSENQEPLKQKLTYMGKFLEGLHELHEKGMVNRDIKSAHIIITTNGSIKLLDYGASSVKSLKKTSRKDLKIISHEYTQGAWKVFTPWYLDPFRTKKPRPSQDIYSVGVVFGELIFRKLLCSDMSIGNIQIVAKYKTLPDLAKYIREPLTYFLKDFAKKGKVENQVAQLINSHFRHPLLRPNALKLSKKYLNLVEKLQLSCNER